MNENQNELDNPNINGQRRRHLEHELESLKKYSENHPDSDYNPTSLELFCDLNPDAIECRIYED